MALTHGLNSTYQSGCKCRPCKDAHAAYQRARYERNLRKHGWPVRGTYLCGVCGSQQRFDHPLHTAGELAETKLAVDLAAKVLTVDVLLWMARGAVAAA